MDYITAKKNWAIIAQRFLTSLLCVFILANSFSFIFLVQPVKAAVNQTFNFQGKLVNITTGTNVITGSPACILAGADTCDFRVSIYNVASGGTALWSEITSDVEIGSNNGVFNVRVGAQCIETLGGTWTTDGDGAGTRCTISGGGVDWSVSPMYIQVDLDVSNTAGQNAFGSPEVFTRKVITSVPTALYADKAGSLGGVSASGFVQLQPNSAQIASNSTNTLIWLNSTVGTPGLIDLQVSGVSKFSIDNNGNVGIKTPASPAYSLNVNGTINIANGNLWAVDGYVRAQRVMVGSNQGTGGIGYIETEDGTQQLGFRFGGLTGTQLEVARFTNNGYFGIGTTTPGRLIDVAGAGSINNLLITQTDGGALFGATQVTQNQLILDSSSSWASSTPRDSVRIWSGIAMSVDGKYQTATVNGGNIYTSSDYGVTWTIRAFSSSWFDVAMSADGKYQTATIYGGNIYTSSDYGVTWTARDSSRNWFGIAMSADGTYQTATENTGFLYTSSDHGATWTARDSNRYWYRVAMSSDGKYQTAVEFGGQIYTSSDYGVTWTARESNRQWGFIAMSADGKYQTATVNTVQPFTSSDYGVTWTARDSSRNWRGVAMTADGKNQTALVGGGNIYTSTDYGVTWTARDSARIWVDVVMSVDGKYQTAIVDNGLIYTSVTSSYTNGNFGIGINTPGRLLDVGGAGSINNLLVTQVDGGALLGRTVVTPNQLVINAASIWASSTARDSSRTWQEVSMSSDGKYQTATANGGNIYTSSDFGVTWTPRDSSRIWRFVAMSADGKYQTAPVVSGQIYTSSDYGVTWTARDSSRGWQGVSMSADGKYQTAVVSPGQLYTSNDFGVTWTPRDSSRAWFGISMSSDGKYQTATNTSPGQVYTSTDYGVTWTARDSNRSWREVSMSADGKYQTATVNGGQIYTSSDYGITWTARDSSRGWQGVAMSADGRYQSATVNGGNIYVSTDYGVTWAAKDASRNWNGIAMSADAKYQTAVNVAGFIYTSIINSSLSGKLELPTTGSIGGLLLGGDANLYRSNANQLRTDSDFVSAGTISLNNNLLAQLDTGVFFGKVGLTQNQVLIDTNSFWASSTARDSSRNWWAIAMSSDGKFQSAVILTGFIYTSTDYGVTWSQRDSSRSWSGIAMSADGKYQTAAANSGQIYTSTDYGVTWTARDSARNWVGVAMSSEGKYQTATVSTGNIYTSTDFGVTWTARDSSRQWQYLAMSSDGKYQTAAVNTGNLYTSTDYGVTWTARDSARNWYRVAMSADGRYQTAGVGNAGNGNLYTSSDFGVTWTARDSIRGWFAIAMTADGKNQTAVVFGGQIYVSTDYGVTWTAKDTTRNWAGLAMSSDGKYQTAGAAAGNVYTSVANAYINGSFGIGTSTPGAQLDVVGNIQNIANSTSLPTQKGSASIASTNPWAVSVSGKYAYIAGFNGFLKIVDVSNPVSPVTISSLAVSGGPQGIYVSGRYAYTVSQTGLFAVIDISNPTAPSIVGSVSVGSPSSVYVSGRYAYITNTAANTLLIYDISNPASPSSVGSVGTGTTPRSVYVAGKYAYVVNNGAATLQVFDISNPASPSNVGSVSTGVGTSPQSVYVSGRYAYVTNWTSNTLGIFDISNPASPTSVGSVSTGAGSVPYSVFVSGRYAYVANQGNSTMGIVDVSNPTSPVSIGSVSTGASTGPRGIYVAGRYAYTANFDGNSLGIFDITGLETTSLIAHSADIGNLQVRNDALIQGQLQVSSGINVGNGGIFTSGSFAGTTAMFNATTSGNVLSISTTANTASSLLFINENGAGTPNLLQIQVGGSDMLLVNNNGQMQFITQGNTGGILIGGDANLYRSAASTLKTDGNFVIAGTVSLGSSGNTLVTDANGEPTLAGNARHSRVIQLNAEYPGAVLTRFYGAGTDTSVTGTMTSDAETSTNVLRTFYEWTSSQASLNNYTVAVRVTLPQDFSAWQTSNALQVDLLTTTNVTTDNFADIYVYNADSLPGTTVASSTTNVSGTGNTWTTVSFTGTSLFDGAGADWGTPGHTGVIYLRLGAKSNNVVRVGDIKLRYLSKW